MFSVDSAAKENRDDILAIVIAMVVVEEPHEEISEAVCVVEQWRQLVLLGQKEGSWRDEYPCQ